MLAYYKYLVLLQKQAWYSLRIKFSGFHGLRHYYSYDLRRSRPASNNSRVFPLKMASVGEAYMFGFNHSLIARYIPIRIISLRIVSDSNKGPYNLTRELITFLCTEKLRLYSVLKRLFVPFSFYNYIMQVLHPFSIYQFIQF